MNPSSIDPLEVTGAAFGIVSVFLSVRQNVWSWPTGIVNVVVYTVIFWRMKIYADMGLQVIYAGLSIYGWYEWLYGGAGKTPLPVSRASTRLLVGAALLGVTTTLLLGTFLDRSTDAAIPYRDSALTSASLIAQWMLTRKILENWLIWIAADIAYIGVFQSLGKPVTAVLYASFLVLATMGWLEWRRDFRRQEGGGRREEATSRSGN